MKNVTPYLHLHLDLFFAKMGQDIQILIKGSSRSCIYLVETLPISILRCYYIGDEGTVLKQIYEDILQNL